MRTQRTHCDGADCAQISLRRRNGFSEHPPPSCTIILLFSWDYSITFSQTQGCVQKCKATVNCLPRIPVPNDERQQEQGSRVNFTSERSPDKEIRRDKLIFFLIFPQIRIWHFMQICSNGEIQILFSEKKKKKKYQNVICWKFYPQHAKRYGEPIHFQGLSGLTAGGWLSKFILLSFWKGKEFAPSVICWKKQNKKKISSSCP